MRAGELRDFDSSRENFTSEINRIMTVISPSHVSELTDPHLIGESSVASLSLRHTHHLTPCSTLHTVVQPHHRLAGTWEECRITYTFWQANSIFSCCTGLMSPIAARPATVDQSYRRTITYELSLPEHSQYCTPLKHYIHMLQGGEEELKYINMVFLC